MTSQRHYHSMTTICGWLVSQLLSIVNRKLSSFENWIKPNRLAFPKLRPFRKTHLYWILLSVSILIMTKYSFLCCPKRQGISFRIWTLLLLISGSLLRISCKTESQLNLVNFTKTSGRNLAFLLDDVCCLEAWSNSKIDSWGMRFKIEGKSFAITVYKT